MSMIPLFNLYKPYRAMREIWQVSQNPKDWENQPTPKLLGVWWGLWILLMFLDIAYFQMPLETIEDFVNSARMAVFVDVVDIAQTITAIMLVTKIAEAQESTVKGDGDGEPF